MGAAVSWYCWKWGLLVAGGAGIRTKGTESAITLFAWVRQVWGEQQRGYRAEILLTGRTVCMAIRDRGKKDSAAWIKNLTSSFSAVGSFCHSFFNLSKWKLHFVAVPTGSHCWDAFINHFQIGFCVFFGSWLDLCCWNRKGMVFHPCTCVSG